MVVQVHRHIIHCPIETAPSRCFGFVLGQLLGGDGAKLMLLLLLIHHFDELVVRFTDLASSERLYRRTHLGLQLCAQ